MGVELEEAHGAALADHDDFEVVPHIVEEIALADLEAEAGGEDFGAVVGGGGAADAGGGEFKLSGFQADQIAIGEAVSPGESITRYGRIDAWDGGSGFELADEFAVGGLTFTAILLAESAPVFNEVGAQIRARGFARLDTVDEAAPAGF